MISKREMLNKLQGKQVHVAVSDGKVGISNASSASIGYYDIITIVGSDMFKVERYDRSPSKKIREVYYCIESIVEIEVDNYLKQ